jgi:MFS family permease
VTRRDGLHRDAVTWAGYTVLSVWAWFLYGFGAVLPLIRAEEGTSRTVMGLHSLAMAGGGLVAGLTTVVVVRRVRRRGAFLIGSGIAAAGIVGLTVGRAPVWTILAALVTGIGGATLLNAATPVISDHHGRNGGAALSEGNAVAALVGLVAPLAIGASVGLGWGWRPPALVLLPLLGVLVLAVRRVPQGVAAMDAGLPPRGKAVDDRRMPLVFWPYLGMVMACVAVEFCCVAWSADLLRQRTSMSPGAASAGVTAVVIGMAVGRFSLGRLALALTPRPLMAGALAVTAAGWLVVWLTTDPVVALAGLVLTGLGIAGHYPLGATMLLTSVPGRMDRAAGHMSLGIAVAAGGAPFALGAVADATSTHTAFVAVPILVTLATAALTVATTLSHRRGGGGRWPRPSRPGSAQRRRR